MKDHASRPRSGSVRWRAVFVLSLAALLLAGAAPAFAQGVGGVVVDESGAPVPQATVRLLGGLRRQSAREEIAVTVAGEGGEFSFAEDRPGTLVLVAEAPGHALGSLLLNSADERRGLRVALRAGAPLRGVVVRARDGAPVAGARLAFEDFPPVFTDGEGRFLFPGLPFAGDPPLIGVSARGFATRDVPLPDAQASRELRIPIEEGAVLRVRVLDAAGAPVAGAAVRGRLPFAVAYSNVERTVYRATTDERGYALVAGLPHGEPVCAEVSAEGYVRGQSEVVLPSPAGEVRPGADVEVRLSEGLLVAVEAVRPGGAPWAGAVATVLPPVEPLLEMGGGSERRATSGPIQVRQLDNRGRAVFSGLPAGPLTLEIRGEGIDAVLAVFRPAESPYLRIVAAEDPDPPGGAFPFLGSIEEAWRIAERRRRPILFTMAMDGERANDWMAAHHFRDPELVRIAREMPVILTNVFGEGSAIPPARGVEHGEADGVCTRYGHGPCADHQRNEGYCVRTFIGEGVPFQVPRQTVVLPGGRILEERTFYLSERDFQRLMLRGLRAADPGAAYELARRRLRPLVAGLLREDAEGWRGAVGDLLLLIHSGDEHGVSLLHGLASLGVHDAVRLEIVRNLTGATLRHPASALAPLLADPAVPVRSAAWRKLLLSGGVADWLGAVESPLAADVPEASPVFDALEARLAPAGSGGGALGAEERRRLLAAGVRAGRQGALDALLRVLDGGGPSIGQGDAHGDLWDAVAVRAVRCPQARELLQRALEAGPAVCAPALEAARRRLPRLPFDGEALDSAGRALGSPNPEVRRSAIRLISEADPPGAFGLLTPLLEDGDESVRLEAAADLLFRDHAGAAALLGDFLYRDRLPAHLMERLRLEYARRAPSSGADFLSWMQRISLIVIESGGSEHDQ